MSNCIFCRIVQGEIPSSKVFEDDDVLAFKDVHPQAPVHILIVPKRHLPTLADATADDAPLLGKMLALAPVVAKDQGCNDGFRTIINTGKVGGQEVYHLHIHVIGGQAALPPMLKH